MARIKALKFFLATPVSNESTKWLEVMQKKGNRDYLRADGAAGTSSKTLKLRVLYDTSLSVKAVRAFGKVGDEFTKLLGSGVDSIVFDTALNDHQQIMVEVDYDRKPDRYFDLEYTMDDAEATVHIRKRPEQP